MKCLPQNKVSQAQGLILHDWHAEVLAIRSFNFFLLEQCRTLALSKEHSSEFLRIRSPEEITESHYQPFAIKDDIELHMYCSEAPCGDASMELTQAAQEDGEPWLVPVKEELNAPPSTVPQLQGRSYFSELGVVRRKPSRPDAPPTLSKSCSDKLALKQCTSLLSSPVSMLISPSNSYLNSLIIPASQYNEVGCNRAFSSEGRMKDLKDLSWLGGYRFQPFTVNTTSKEFAYSRRQTLTSSEKIVPSNIAASWVQGTAGLETIIGGVKQGRKIGDIKGASRASKFMVWKLAMEISMLVAVPSIQRSLCAKTYGEMKRGESLEIRRKVKSEVPEKGLKGWVRNTGGEEFGMPAEGKS